MKHIVFASALSNVSVDCVLVSDVSGKNIVSNLLLLILYLGLQEYQDGCVVISSN